jgi:hypothetical protein
MTALHVVTLALPVLLPGLVLIVSLKKGWFARLRRPLDGGATWRGKPVLGQNKTWFGVLLYLVGGAAVAGVLAVAGPAAAPVFEGVKALAVGASVGAAYSVGEIVNSFVKRRLRVPPGQVVNNAWRRAQISVDLADGIVCASIVYFAWGVSAPMAVAVCVFGLGLHVGTDVLMRRLSLKRGQRDGARDGDGHVVEAPGADTLDHG